MICNKLKDCVDANFAEPASSIICMNVGTECIEFCDNRSQVKCEEKGKRYVLKNTRACRVIKFYMDGGVIRQDAKVPPGTLKCDNVIVLKDALRKAIFIELKGENVAHALKQLLATLEREKELVNSCGKVYVRIVLACAVPKLQTTKEYIRLQKLVLQKGGNIKTHSINFEEKDTELDIL